MADGRTEASALRRAADSAGGAGATDGGCGQSTHFGRDLFVSKRAAQHEPTTAFSATDRRLGGHKEWKDDRGVVQHIGRDREVEGRAAKVAASPLQLARPRHPAEAVPIDVLLDERKDDPLDLFMVYYGGTDVLAHRFFRWAYPDDFTHRPSDAQLQAYGHIMPKYYEEFDRMLGELMERAPENANIIVVSDHGMHAVNADKPFKGDLKEGEKGGRRLSGGHNTAPPACLIAAGPQIVKPSQPMDLSKLEAGVIPKMGRVLTVTPTILHILGIPTARDMKGHPSKQILSPSFMAANPVGKVNTHTPKGWKPTVVEVDMKERNEDARKEQLRALGYIE